MRLVLQRSSPWIVVLGLALLASRGAVAQNIPVTLGGQTSSLVGVDFDVPIEIDLSGRAELLGSFALTVRWNPSVLQLVSGQEAEFGHLTVNEDSLFSGAAILAGASPAGVGGRVIVAVARFRPLVADTTTLRMSVGELYAAESFADLTSFALPTDRQFCPALGRFGDLDGDGAANSRDALIAMSASIGLDMTGFQVAMGDVDANGLIETRDALIILSRSVGLDVSAFRVFTIAPGTCVVPTATSLVLDPGDITVTIGQRIVYTAIGVDGAGNATTVTDVFWSSDNPTVATVGPSGLVASVGVGTANISVVRGGGDRAGATVTVVSDRRVHWVDALAFNAVNQLGTPALPFGTIQEALDFAVEGDTVKVRPGRYAEALMVDRGVVLEGDTTGGALRPLVSTPALNAQWMTVLGARRLELHNFRSDSLFRAMDIVFADSVLLRNVEFRQSQDGATTIDVDTVTTLEIEHSRFFGSGVNEYGYAVEINVGAGLFRMDSTRVSEYGDGGLYLIGVDSIDIRRSALEHFYGRGIYVCASCAGQRMSALVLSESRIADLSYYEPLSMDGFRRAQLDHNVIVGEDEGIYLYNPSEGVGIVSLLGDSVVALGSYSLDVDGYDSLTVDSIHVSSYDGVWLERGRYTNIEDSQIEVTGNYSYGLQIDPYPLDSATVIGRLHNLVIDGPDPGVCDRCYSGVEVGWGHWEIDGLTTSNWDEAITFWDADATIRNVNVSDAWYGIYWYCGKTRITNLTATDVDYGVYTSGCELTDSVTVDSSSIDFNYAGIYVDEATAILRNNDLRSSVGGSYGIQVYNAPLYTVGNRIGPVASAGITYDGLYYSGTYPTVPAEIARDTVACGGAGTGIYGYDASLSVLGVVVSGCRYGIYVNNSDSRLQPATPVEVRASTIAVPSGGYYGIYALGNDRADLSLIGNTVTGSPTYGALYVGASSGMPRVEIDSNVVDGVSGSAIYAQRADTVRIRWNTVSNLAAGSSEAGGAAAILLGYADAADAIAEIRGNRVTAGTGTGIRLYRSASTDTVTVQVDSNVVQGIDSMGVWVSYYSRARVTRNAIDGVGLDAVYVDRSSNDAAATVINNNNFTSSGRYGINNRDGVAIDGSNNWWNHTAGPSGFYGEGTGVSTGDSVSVNVVWDPHLTAPEGSAPTPAPPVWLTSLLTQPVGRAVPADATAVASVSLRPSATDVEGELEMLRQENEDRRVAQMAERADREAQRAARRAEVNAEREAQRQDAKRRRAEAQARGGQP